MACEIGIEIGGSEPCDRMTAEKFHHDEKYCSLVLFIMDMQHVSISM